MAFSPHPNTISTTRPPSPSADSPLHPKEIPFISLGSDTQKDSPDQENGQSFSYGHFYVLCWKLEFRSEQELYLRGNEGAYLNPGLKTQKVRGS